MQHPLVENDHTGKALHLLVDFGVDRAVAHVIDDAIERTARVEPRQIGDRPDIQVALQLKVGRILTTGDEQYNFGIPSQVRQQLFAIVRDTGWGRVDRGTVGEALHQAYYVSRIA
jgi:hypothetical protein